jgi:hypothetical protein
MNLRPSYAEISGMADRVLLEIGMIKILTDREEKAIHRLIVSAMLVVRREATRNISTT